MDTGFYSFTPYEEWGVPSCGVRAINTNTRVITIPTSEFGAGRLSVSFFVPLSSRATSMGTTIPVLLSEGSVRCPAVLDLGHGLTSLCKTIVRTSISGINRVRRLGLNVAYLSSHFSLSNRGVATRYVGLLLSVTFGPLLSRGNYFPTSHARHRGRILVRGVRDSRGRGHLCILGGTRRLVFTNRPCTINGCKAERRVTTVAPRSTATT